MNEPIVIELQQLASDGKCPVDELLRKALIVATKLKLDDFKDWINLELVGYSSPSEVPEYRVVQAILKVLNPVTGQRMPVFFEAPDDEHRLSHFLALQAIGELQHLVSSGAKHLQSPFSPQEKQRIMRQMDTPVPMECQRLVSVSSLAAILNAVRNIILDWSLRLEEQGILGEGMRFSQEEKAIAMTSQNIHIGSFQGVLGNVSESNVTQNQQMTINAGDFESLRKQLDEAGIDKTDLDALKQALDSDPEPESKYKFGPNVSSWIGNILGKAASGVWKVTLETASKLIPTAIASYYGLKG